MYYSPPPPARRTAVLAILRAQVPFSGPVLEEPNRVSASLITDPSLYPSVEGANGRIVCDIVVFKDGSRSRIAPALINGQYHVHVGADLLYVLPEHATFHAPNTWIE